MPKILHGLVLIEIDPGTGKPYYLTNTQYNSELDNILKNYLKDESISRGIFLELPELDLIDVNQLSNYERLIDFEDIINEKYNDTFSVYESGEGELEDKND